MSIHIEEVPCTCAWCLAGHASLHRVTRMWFDDERPPSPEAKAVMDEVIRNAIEAVQRTQPQPECICPKCGLRHGGSSVDGGF